jgi:hypothetical protein
MAANEAAGELLSQIAYHRRELELFEDADSMLDLGKKPKQLVLKLIVRLHEQLATLSAPQPVAET